MLIRSHGVASSWISNQVNTVWTALHRHVNRSTVDRWHGKHRKRPSPFRSHSRQTLLRSCRNYSTGLTERGDPQALLKSLQTYFKELLLVLCSVHTLHAKVMRPTRSRLTRRQRTPQAPLQSAIKSAYTHAQSHIEWKFNHAFQVRLKKAVGLLSKL